MTTKQELSSWKRLAGTIGYGIVEQITRTDAMNHARMIAAVIIDSGYHIAFNGKEVITDHPMDAAAKRGWQAYQPALRRLFDE